MRLLLALLLAVTAYAATDPGALWEQAKGFLERQQYSDARRVLTQAVQSAPKDAALWYYLGVSCAALKENGPAIQALEKARALAPKRAEVYFSLGLEYWRRGDAGKAKEAYRTGLGIQPDDTGALQNYALLLMKTGEPEQAIEPLSRLKQIPELSLPARVSLIECYSKTGDRTRMDQEVDEILRSGIAGPAEETKLAIILVQGHNTTEAAKLLRDSLAKEPNQANARAALGAILIDEKRYEDAAKELQQAVLLAPDSSEYALAFAESLLLWNRPNDLLAFLKNVEDRFGSLPEFQYKLALAYYRLSKLPETISTLEKLLASQPRRQDQIYFMLGNAYFSLNRNAEAEMAYRHAVEINPKDAAYYEPYATLLRKGGPDRLDDAISLLKRGLQFFPANPALSLQLALCYESKGDNSNALGLAESVVRAKPDLLSAHVALARIYFKLGRKVEGQAEKKAIAALEAAGPKP